MIQVGDIVRVTDWGRQYSRFTDWFKEHTGQLKTEWLIKYAYGDETHYGGFKCNDITRYRVLYIDIVDEVCLITRMADYSDKAEFEVYLIGLNGVELYDKPTEMTISEIEEKLGIRNLKIIKED